MTTIYWFLAITLLFLGVNSAHASGSQSIKVVTYNVWGVPLKNPTLDIRLKGLCEVLKRQAKASDGWDVILLQELWRKDDQTFIAKSCGYPYQTVSEDNDNPILKMTDIKAVKSGLLILSKFPIEQEERVYFKNEIPASSGGEAQPTRECEPDRLFEDGECIGSKGLQLVKLKVGERAIWVANTHLISFYPEAKITYENRRSEQLEEAIAFVASQIVSDEAEALPLIFGGDLNVAPGREVLWDHIPSLFFDNFKFNLTQAAFDNEKDCTSCPPNSFAKVNEGKLDHLWFSPQFKINKARRILTGRPIKNQHGKWIQLSDHFGWLTTVEF